MSQRKPRIQKGIRPQSASQGSPRTLSNLFLAGARETAGWVREDPCSNLADRSLHMSAHSALPYPSAAGVDTGEPTSLRRKLSSPSRKLLGVHFGGSVQELSPLSKPGTSGRCGGSIDSERERE